MTLNAGVGAGAGGGADITAAHSREQLLLDDDTPSPPLIISTGCSGAGATGSPHPLAAIQGKKMEKIEEEGIKLIPKNIYSKMI
jgi:hypothetical protein